MSEAGHHGGCMPLGQLNQCVLQAIDQTNDAIDFAA
jgi:hypothetical protein